MRLLNVESSELQLEEFFGDNIPPYAILSHTWERNEVLFRDLETHHHKHKLGYKKIKFTCEQARKDGLHWCWVDTCCIDKSSSAELSEAINSMFNWYKRAKVCYAYLSDVDANETRIASMTKSPGINQAAANFGATDAHHCSKAPFVPEVESMNLSSDVKMPTARSTMVKTVKDSRWFRRGWTLQELIAPRVLRFYDLDWEYLGDRDRELSGVMYARTGLDFRILGQPGNLRDISIAQRMSWMADRQTTRKEDEAYCMLGIFGVNMPLLYGEEERAFTRLQEELIKRSPDHSLLIFSDPALQRSGIRRILATSPTDFRRCKEIEASGTIGDIFPLHSFNLTNDGIDISLPLVRGERSRGHVDLAVLDYSYNGSPIGLVLSRQQLNSEVRFVRNLRHHSLGLFEQGTVELQWLGTGVVSIPEEIAITAERQRVLIRADGSLGARRHDIPEHDTWLKYDTWLRYDLAMQYEMASPDCGLERTFVQHGGVRPPHMIRLRPLRREVTVVKFSLAEIEPLVIIAAFDFFGRDEVRGALLVTEDGRVTTLEQLSIIGANMCSEIKHKNIGRICIEGGPLARICLEGIGTLDLEHDGIITDSPGGPLGLRRVTLRIRSEIRGDFWEPLLSDGRQV